MSSDRIIAATCELLQQEQVSRKRHRYQREETRLQRMRVALAGDREQWLRDTLETEEVLG